MNNLINKIKSLVSSYMLKNQYANVDMRLMVDIYETIKDYSPERERLFVCHHPDFGYLHTGDTIRLKDGCVITIMALQDGFVVMRYSGYYPFVIDVNNVIDKINQINQ